MGTPVDLWPFLGLAVLFPSAILGQTSYLECRNYFRADNSRFLPVQMTYDGNETPTGCIAKCKAIGLDFAGMQVSDRSTASIDDR